MKHELKKYNPYVYLVLDDSCYEEDVIKYYNSFKKLHNNSKSFRDRVIKANDEEVSRLIEEFLSKEDDVLSLIKELKNKIRLVKDIILITESANVTKKHIEKIDKRVNNAIDLKNKKLKTKENDLEKLSDIINNFITKEKFTDDSIKEFKENIKKLINHCEETYSFDEFNKMIKNINKLKNAALDKKMKQFSIYKYDNYRINQLIVKYKDAVINDEISFIKWVENVKKEYEEIKKSIIERYPTYKINESLEFFDEKIDDLIDNKMYENYFFNINDEKKLKDLFDDYRESIINIQHELENYPYYDHMTDSEKFNIKRELYEDKIRKFKRNIREFNKNLRIKYSRKYANEYVNDNNKRADNFIKKLAPMVEMPVPNNPWIVRKYLWADTENFVSDIGIKFRKIINKPLQKVVRLAMKNKLIIEEMPKFNPNKQYVFISTHYFTEDVIGLFSATDRQAHMLMGTTDQIENNPLMLAAVLFGFFHVDRIDSEDRKECFEKQNLLIEKGTSFINYIGGSWENSENELQPLSFSGAYRTSKMKDVLIIPVASYLVREDKKIYMRFGEPIDVRKCDEQKANEIIRDTLAMMHYKQISKYSSLISNIKVRVNGKNVKTHNLPYDQHVYYMDQIGDEYWNQPWTKPFAKEEIGVRKSKVSTEEEVYGFISNLSREKLIELSKYLGDVMVKIDEKERYDIIKYLDSNYDKFKKRSLKKK